MVFFSLEIINLNGYIILNQLNYALKGANMLNVLKSKIFSIGLMFAILVLLILTTFSTRLVDVSIYSIIFSIVICLIIAVLNMYLSMQKKRIKWLPNLSGLFGSRAIFSIFSITAVIMSSFLFLSFILEERFEYVSFSAESVEKVSSEGYYQVLPSLKYSIETKDKGVMQSYAKNILENGELSNGKYLINAREFFKDYSSWEKYRLTEITVSIQFLLSLGKSSAENELLIDFLMNTGSHLKEVSILNGFPIDGHEVTTYYDYVMHNIKILLLLLVSLCMSIVLLATCLHFSNIYDVEK